MVVTSHGFFAYSVDLTGDGVLVQPVKHRLKLAIKLQLSSFDEVIAPTYWTDTLPVQLVVKTSPPALLHALWTWSDQCTNDSKWPIDLTSAKDFAPSLLTCSLDNAKVNAPTPIDAPTV